MGIIMQYWPEMRETEVGSGTIEDPIENERGLEITNVNYKNSVTNGDIPDITPPMTRKRRRFLRRLLNMDCKGQHKSQVKTLKSLKRK